MNYTPSTEQIRNFWASDGTEQPAAKSYDRAEGLAEFDRWLADIIYQHALSMRSLLERAWDAGNSMGPARDSEPDEYAINKRDRTVDRLVDEFITRNTANKPR